MGMFDTVYCQHPLPVEWAQDLDYQTKSLDCLLDTFYIDTDGALWRLTWQGDDHEDIEAEPIERTLEMHFYTNLPIPDAPLVMSPDDMRREGWIEWKATIIRGQVDEIELVTLEMPKPESAKEDSA